jgi:hypothetical protein
MAHQTFKLISTYDLVPDSQQTEHLFRIEIFQGLEQDTYLIDDLELITGITGISESQVLARANAAVEKLCEALRG